MNDLQSILNQISAVLKGYDQTIKSSSDNYNIFKILNLQTDEVNLHSLFLAELLNPRGSHKKGTAFLKCFIKITKIELYETFNFDKASLSVEKFIGPISDNKEKGGRIDIILEDNQRQCIIIENKIYAGDQYKQLIRYHNYKAGRSGVIFYLTLDGKEPSITSCGDLRSGEDFELISYNITIIEWLEKCHQIASDSPFVRETIKQYINLIKIFSGQTIFKEMYEDIKTTIIHSQQNFESAYQIASEFKKIKIELLLSFWSEAKVLLESDLGNEYEVSFKKDALLTGANYPGFWVKERIYGNDINCNFVLESLNGKSGWNNGKLYYGIWIGDKNPLVKKTLPKLLERFDRNSKKWTGWLVYYEFQGLNFNGKNTLKQILPNSTSRSELMKEITTVFSNYIKENGNLMKQIRDMIYT